MRRCSKKLDAIEMQRSSSRKFDDAGVWSGTITFRNKPSGQPPFLRDCSEAMEYALDACDVRWRFTQSVDMCTVVHY